MKATIADAWQADAISIVNRPPTRSVSQPQNIRLTNALPSNTESINAPRAGVIPRSLQSATRCVGGMAIGAQHRNPAKHRSQNVLSDALRTDPWPLCSWIDMSVA